MEALASMLQGAMGGRLPMVQTINNHAAPLHFETYGGSVHDGRIQDVRSRPKCMSITCLQPACQRVHRQLGAACS